MIEFITGYTTGVTLLDRLADFGVIFVLGVIIHFTGWATWDRVRFTRGDALDERCTVGAYTGDTSIQPATHATPRHRSPFARTRS